MQKAERMVGEMLRKAASATLVLAEPFMTKLEDLPLAGHIVSHETTVVAHLDHHRARRRPMAGHHRALPRHANRSGGISPARLHLAR